MSAPDLSASDLAEIAELLTVEHQDTSARIAALRADVTSIIDAARDTATDDEHDPEGQTIAYERSQASSLLVAAISHLEGVRAAQSRLDEGDYGRCLGCGAAIHRERLLARPAATHCITCASQPRRR